MALTFPPASPVPARTALVRTGLAALALIGGLIGPAPQLHAADIAPHPEARRIVTVGGTVTEIAFALGAGDRIVAVDSTSSYPEATAGKANVGYMRTLSAEGVLSMAPDLVIAEDGAGPADALALLTASGVPVEIIPTPPEAGRIPEKIAAVGHALGLDDAAAALARDTGAALDRLAAEVAALPGPRKRVLFALSFAGGRITAGGRGTEADAIIRFAGGENAAAAMEGYKPMSDEAVIAAAPDLVLTMRRGAHAVSAAEIFALPALAGSPAAATQSYAAMDGVYLLGFGPRTPAAARELVALLHPGSLQP